MATDIIVLGDNWLGRILSGIGAPSIWGTSSLGEVRTISCPEGTFSNTPPFSNACNLRANSSSDSPTLLPVGITWRWIEFILNYLAKPQVKAHTESQIIKW